MAKKEYIEANRRWLEQKAQEPGVNHIHSGVYYKVLKKGKNDGIHPNPRSVVMVHYSGRTINGKKFDSSYGGVAPAFRLNQLIKGWVIAMQKMCVGDKWEVYIPAELAYGNFNQPGIPGGSTLIFEIELCGIA